MKAVKTIWNTITTIFIAIVALLAIALVGVKLFGIEIYTVLSGSMEPAYKTGSVIYVKPVDTAELQEGDVITFHLTGETIATHRIIEVLPEEDGTGAAAFRTKGDANDVEDGSPVSAEAVIGSPVFTISGLGFLVSYLQSPSGRFAVIGAGLLLILLLFLPSLIFDSGKDEKQKGAENNAD